MNEKPPTKPLTSITLPQYVKGLEFLAKQKWDRANTAQHVIDLTVYLLRGRVDDRITDSLFEAKQIIWRATKKQTAVQQRQKRDIWCSVVVSLLNEEGVPLQKAAKKLYDNDAAEVGRLLRFRNNLKHNKKAKDEYFSIKKKLRSAFPNGLDTASLVSVTRSKLLAKNG